ncbi:alpha-D-ribose 1-methylphosphonate 5-triphosphate diphosphatase [Uliginosibacterium sp. H1]|uniref:alpha-D-ribose 1-methylphosphonate 5-triphosphate diphosphatase n=1 Tax=Uliginosibacterium sp. H1 TaxID=3114757 RepID=UPI002E17B4A3|nr:alpha-D-ribose 1-methylphosphonate 5-triphosphate diphosphatase [Uliginosibacterium sp. H1]
MTPASSSSSASPVVVTLKGGSHLHADGHWAREPLHLDGELLTDAQGTTARWLDTTDCLVLPGIVDFHGDAFERQIMPRPGVRFPLDVAMMDTDRQLAANGITTAFHGITYSWEGGLRGRDTALQLFESMERLQTHFLVEHRAHIRFECHNLAGEADVAHWMEAGKVGVLAFNDHLPGMRKKQANLGKMKEYADRAETDVEGFLARMESAAERAGEVPLAIKRLAAKARRYGVPMASHDDTDVTVREYFDDLHCHISEFPLTRDVAEMARTRNTPVVCGGPNVLRGGSHVGAPSAATLAGDGLCSILASDYYYPAPLFAAFRLAELGLLSLAQAWQLVSRNPAQALALQDRGEIAAGKRADLLVIDPRVPAQPRLVATLSAGRLVYLSEGSRLHG